MRRRVVPLLLAAALLGAAALAAKQEHPLPTYPCHRTSRPVIVDGKVEEAAWKQAQLFTDFRLADGVTKPTYATEFRALWDAQSLYLSFVCQDPVIVATMTKRDSPLYAEDCVECFLSTGGDLWRYFEFELSPKNVQMDASVFPTPGRRDKIVDYSWNCRGLRTATHVEGEGTNQRWSIEIAIPFTSIGRNRKAPTVGQTWRANFYRAEYSVKPEEYACWSPMYGPADFHRRDRFGYFVFAR